MNVGEKYKELYLAVMEEHEKVFEKQDLAELEQFMELICKAKRIFSWVWAGKEFPPEDLPCV